MNLIKGLSIITSCGCNLQCSYCRISQSKNELSPILQKNTIQALQDGTFLENIKQVLYKLSQHPSNIQQIAFWGQEPTLTLKYITQNMSAWMTTLPNLTNIMFSTNGMDNTSDILDFIYQLDANLNHQLELEIQFSFDGEESTNDIRNADSQKIFNNLIYLITELNKYNFKYVTLKLNFHGVISLDLIKSLKTYADYERYYSNLNNWADYFYHLNLNKNVNVAEIVNLALENPLSISSMTALDVAHFFEISNRMMDDKAFESANSPFFGARNCINILKNHFRVSSLSILFEQVRNGNISIEDICNFSNQFLYCGNNYSELKIMYDGTLINCQNSIFETNPEYINKTNDLAYDIKQGLAKKNYFLNPLTDSQEEISKTFDKFYTAKSESFQFIYSAALIYLLFLSKTNQALPKYKDNYILMQEHAYLIALYNTCAYNHYVETGTIFLNSLSSARVVSNGIADFYERNS